MKHLTIGQVLGIHKLSSIIPPVFQYKSRRDNRWRYCTSKWDMLQYEKYGYEIREFFT